VFVGEFGGKLKGTQHLGRYNGRSCEANETVVTSYSSLLMGPDRLTMLISFLRVVPCVGGSR